MAQSIDIDLIYKRVLVRLGIKTLARKMYVQKLINQFNAKPTQSALKKLFLLTRMINSDMTREELGQLCLNDPEAACAYAWTIVKGKWPEGESVIHKSKEYAYTYAKFVLKLPDEQARAW